MCLRAIALSVERNRVSTTVRARKRATPAHRVKVMRSMSVPSATAPSLQTWPTIERILAARSCLPCSEAILCAHMRSLGEKSEAWVTACKAARAADSKKLA